MDFFCLEYEKKGGIKMNFVQFINAQIQTIQTKDPSVHSWFEVLFFPGFKAMNYWYFSHKLYLARHYGLARILSLIAQRKTGIDIHPGARIGANFFIDHGAGVVIGETCIIGKNVTIFQGVTLGANGKEQGKRHPNVEDDVLIGAGAKIIGNITLHQGCKIGAGAVVVKDVPAYTTMISTPAHALKRKAALPKRISESRSPENEPVLPIVRICLNKQRKNLLH
jgi:serine O-acetyltransferase